MSGLTLGGCALVIAVSSPIPVALALVLLVHNDQPRSSSIGFLSGRVVTVCAASTASMLAPRILAAVDTPSPAWASWVIATVGALLIVLGASHWRRRGGTSRGPGWEEYVATMGPKSAAAAGILTALNVKVLAVSAAVGAHVGAQNLTVLDAAGMVSSYAVLANSIVAAPILAYLIAGARIDPLLKHLRQWLLSQHRALRAALLLTGGCLIIVYAFAAPGGRV